MFCSKCGNEIKESMKFCPKCGSQNSRNINYTQEALSDNKKTNSIKENDSNIQKNIIGNNGSVLKKFVNIKTIIGAIVLVVIACILCSIGGGDSDEHDSVKAVNNTDSTEVAETNISAKMRNGNVVTDFTKISDKLYISKYYEEYKNQCPYEKILEQKNFKLYDKICLLEHTFDEHIDEDRVQQVDGLTHYCNDTIRIMCQYTDEFTSVTVKKYYDVCMTNFWENDLNNWKMMANVYLFDDEEVDYAGLNDTYWYVEGNALSGLSYNIFMDGGLLDSYYMDSDKVKLYIHFRNLEDVQIRTTRDSGMLALNYSNEHEICDMKIIYEDKCVEGVLAAGGNGDDFLRASFGVDDVLVTEMYVHPIGAWDSSSLLRFENTGSSRAMTKITKTEFDNTSGVIVKNNDKDNSVEAYEDYFEEDDSWENGATYSNEDIIYQVIVDAPDGYVNVRADASADSEILFEVPNGCVEGIAGEDGGWLIIPLSPGGANSFGYIHSSQVSVIKLEPGSEYIIDGSDSGYFDQTYLNGFSQWDCRLARNEIYARHGKIFKDETLQSYFSDCSWYTALYEDVPDSMLNQWEIENIKTIINYEQQMGYR